MSLDELRVKDLLFLDESGADTRLVRRYARSLRGERATGSAPLGSYERLTFVGALSCTGLLATHTLPGAMNTNAFLSYLDEVLIPALKQHKPGATLVMDNLPVHKVAGVRTRLEAAGLGLLYLPPYSPDRSPVEQSWSKVKTLLRGVAARTRESLETALQDAFASVTAKDAQGWFHHCGYSTL